MIYTQYLDQLAKLAFLGSRHAPVRVHHRLVAAVQRMQRMRARCHVRLFNCSWQAVTWETVTLIGRSCDLYLDQLAKLAFH